ncbi:glycosyltransferase family 2 protein [Paractinoplanes globisporus]|uniref:Glycosyltransferase family 2 protein n=1 Tax=Paractinoplanes globisporus TaxID=113565 RepID=A0ABW6WEZ9_9ACTN|nr:glycosyltransferase family 2 protein [Actinoplanes globisporus]
MLTVIILTYNSGNSLSECLESLTRQTTPPAEVLVVDDDSTDGTLDIVRTFQKRGVLPLRILRNGSHVIARGRNIGLRAAATPVVAFMDSDAWAEPEWVEAILKTLDANPGVGIVGGEVLAAHASRFAHAIATNDGAVRELTASGELLCGTCNLGVHRERVGYALFDERWVYAEDVEYVSRVGNWTTTREARVWHESRRGPSAYFRQMRRYGLWKLHYTVRTRNVRLVDYVPSVVLLVSVAACVVSPAALLALPLLSISEALFVAVYRRAPLPLLPLMAWGWLVKNTGWGLGMLIGLCQLLVGRGPHRSQPNVHA